MSHIERNLFMEDKEIIYTRESIKQFIADYKQETGRFPKGNSVFQDALKKYTDFLPDDSKQAQRAFHLWNNIENIPKCLNESCDNSVKWNSLSRYATYCSAKCGKAGEKFELFQNLPFTVV